MGAFLERRRLKVRRAESFLALGSECLVSEMWWIKNLKSVQLQISQNAGETLANVLLNVELSFRERLGCFQGSEGWTVVWGGGIQGPGWTLEFLE